MARIVSQTFDEIMENAIENGIIPTKNEEAITWYRKKVKLLGRKIKPEHFTRERDRMTGRIEYGKLYHFWYYPKYEESLPFYDRFPLCFPIKRTSNGFYGINMHYLDHRLRARFMTNLYDTVNNQKYDDSTRLILTYRMLNRSARFKYFRPCIKHYLRKQVRSPFIEIYPLEWSVAMFLPTESFEVLPEDEIWENSRMIIREFN